MRTKVEPILLQYTFPAARDVHARQQSDHLHPDTTEFHRLIIANFRKNNDNNKKEIKKKTIKNL